jgi:hypothetical protein
MLSDHMHFLVNITDFNQLVFFPFFDTITPNRLKDRNTNGTPNVCKPFKEEAQTALFKAPGGTTH